ncbi:MAG: hypothetical protein AAF591_02280 [Verrucomicrobiota bacterium]
MSTAWIQSADCSSEDIAECTPEEAVSIFSQHDWQSERRKEEELRKGGQDHCPAGMGFLGGDGSILHVVPRDDETCMVHYHFNIRTKILGLFSVSNQATHTIDFAQTSEVLKLTADHYQFDSDKVIRVLNALPKDGL